MEKDMRIIENIRSGKTNQKEFFLRKMQEEFKEIDHDELESLFLEVLNSYRLETPVPLLFYLTNQIRKKLVKVEWDNTALFTDKENQIIQRYLTSENQKYFSTEEIAKEFQIDVAQVVFTIQKLKELIQKHPHEISQQFGDVSALIKKRNRWQSHNLSKNNSKLNSRDIELIGLFTGQINDICVDIDELAEKYHTNELLIRQDLIRIFSILQKQDNFNIVGNIYPGIEKMLSIRANILNIKFISPHQKETKNSISNISEDIKILKSLFQRSNGYFPTQVEIAKDLSISPQSLSYLKKKILNKLNTDHNYKQQILREYPTLFEDIKAKEDMKELRNEKNEYSHDILTHADFLKLLFQKREGHYLSQEQIAKKLSISSQNLSYLKKKILNELDKNHNYKQQILREYPNLLNDMEEKESEMVNRKERHMERNIKILQLLFQKQEGNYLSQVEIAKRLSISPQYLNLLKNSMLNKINTDEDYKQQLLKEYPTLLEDIEEKKNTKNQKVKKSEKIQQSEDILIHVMILKMLFQKKNQNYLTQVEIAKKLSITPQYFSLLKKKILNKINTDEDYKQQLLKEYPTLLEDIEEKKNSKSQGKGKIKVNIERDVNILKLLFQRQNEAYLTQVEIAKKLSISLSYLSILKNNIFNNMNTDHDYKQQILEEYLTLFEDMERKENRKEQENKNAKKSIERDVKILKLLFQKQNEAYLTQAEIAKKLSISRQYFSLLKKMILNKIETDQNYKQQVLRDYPTLFEDIEKKGKKKRKKTPKNISAHTEILKLLFEKRNGTYLSQTEIAKKLSISPQSLSQLKKKVLNRINTDEDYKQQILEEYPTLLEDIEEKREQKVQQKATLGTNIERDIQAKKESLIHRDAYTLKLLFQLEKEIYPSQTAVAKILHISKQNLNIRKKKILQRLDTDDEYRDEILKQYPTLLEDMEKQKKKTIKDIRLTPYITPIIHQIDSKKVKNHPKIIPSQENLSTRQKRIKTGLQQGLQKLEELENQAFLQTCNSKQKIMLALHLGFLEQIPFKNEELADMFQEKVESVNTLIENFEKSMPATNNKTYKKE